MAETSRIACCKSQRQSSASSAALILSHYPASTKRNPTRCGLKTCSLLSRKWAALESTRRKAAKTCCFIMECGSRSKQRQKTHENRINEISRRLQSRELHYPGRTRC